MCHKIIWENLEEFGFEYLKLSYRDRGIMAEGTIITLENNTPYKASYKIHLNHSWVTKKLEVIADDNFKLEIISDGKGNWFKDDGQTINQLSGAIDIDISVTPFSNSLPINRCEWTLKQKRNFQMVYVSVPALKFYKVPQSYTYLKRVQDSRIFLYECRDFESLIFVDDNGLVTSYPNLFYRKY